MTASWELSTLTVTRSLKDRLRSRKPPKAFARWPDLYRSLGAAPSMRGVGLGRKLRNDRQRLTWNKGTVSTSIGEFVKKARETAGLTLGDLSRESGVSKSMLSRLERGERRSLTLKTAAAICDVLDLSLDELAGRSDPKALARRRPLRRAVARARRLAADLQETLRDLR